MHGNSFGRKISLALMIAGFVWCVPARGDDDVVVVKVKGQGSDEAAAVKDAQRQAVDKNAPKAGSELEHQVVVARASTLATDYKVTSKTTVQSVTNVEVEVKISRKALDSTEAQVAAMLKQLGRPKIMVIFTEIIHDLDRAEPNREIVQHDSILGTQIERKLLSLGFKLVNAGQMKEVDRKKADAAAIENDTAALKAIASSYGAAIYIKGASRASGPQHTTASGIDLNMWETDVTVQGFWTETADAIFSNSMTGVRGGSRVAGPVGGRQALEKNGKQLADASVLDMLEAWGRGSADGGGMGDVLVEVSNVADIKQSLEIKKALGSLKGVDEVTKDGAKGVVKYTVVTKQTAEQVAEKLIEVKFADFSLDITDQKAKTIACKVK